MHRNCGGKPAYLAARFLASDVKPIAACCAGARAAVADIAVCHSALHHAGRAGDDWVSTGCRSRGRACQSAIQAACIQAHQPSPTATTCTAGKHECGSPFCRRPPPDHSQGKHTFCTRRDCRCSPRSWGPCTAASLIMASGQARSGGGGAPAAGAASRHRDGRVPRTQTGPWCLAANCSVLRAPSAPWCK